MESLIQSQKKLPISHNICFRAVFRMFQDNIKFQFLALVNHKSCCRDKRKMMLFSLSCFIFYHVFTLPWPFFDGPLDYIELGRVYSFYIPVCLASTFQCTVSKLYPFKSEMKQLWHSNVPF